MNGLSANHVYRALPATAVLRLSPQRAMSGTSADARGSETVLAAVNNPPRGGEPRPMAALVTEVLARYGLTKEFAASQAVDLLA